MNAVVDAPPSRRIKELDVMVADVVVETPDTSTTLPGDIESQTDHIVHICAGSGSVPNFSMVKYALESHPRLRHTLIYSNKTWQDIIFRDALAGLERKHPERLRVIHTLTREPDVSICGPFVLNARIKRESYG